MKKPFEHRHRVIAVALIIVISMTAVPLAAADSSVASSARTIINQNPAPGETVTVSVETELNSSGDRLGIEDEITPAAGGSLNLESVTINGEAVQPSLSLSDDEFIDITVDSSFSAGDQVRITYSIPIPENVSEGETFDISGSTTLDGSPKKIHTGDSTITIQEQTEPIELSNRVITTNNATSGETVEISLNVEFGQNGNTAIISDSFDPAFGEVQVDQVFVNDTSVTPSAVTVNNESLTVELDNVSSGSIGTVIYSVTLPSTTDPNQVYTFDGSSKLDNSEPVTHSGDQSLSTSGTGAIASVDRDLDRLDASPGDIITVSVSAELAQAGDRVSIEEEFTPGFTNNTSLESIRYNGESTYPVTNIEDSEFISVTLQEAFDGGDTVELMYTVEVPENASIGSTFNISGEVGYDSLVEGISSDEISVSEKSGEIRISNQTGGGEDVVVDTAIASANYSIAILNADGELVGQSEEIAANTAVNNHTVTLESSLDRNQEVTAAIYQGTSENTFTVGGETLQSSAQYEVNIAARYANNDNVVTGDGLRSAVSDWRNGELNNNELRMILEAWRTGQPVVSTNSPGESL